jgi:hypothetical protein
MADVFISYSRLDYARVRPIADRIASSGYQVWWDKDLQSGQVFADEIERQINDARAVLTAWSHNARNSTWVYAEASRGLDAHKLVQIKLDSAQLPLPFDALQVTDFSGKHGDWLQLENGINRLVRGGNPPDPVRVVPNVSGTPPVAGSPKLLTGLTTAGLGAYAVALSNTHYGSGLSPDQLQMAMTGLIGVAGASAVLTAQRLLAITRAGG